VHRATALRRSLALETTQNAADFRPINETPILSAPENRKIFAAIALFIALAAAAFWWGLGLREPPTIAEDDSLPAICRKIGFEDIDHIICEVDPAAYRIRLFHSGSDGKPYASLKSFEQAMAAQGRMVLMAMNAGMYHENLSPVGLYIEEGRTLSPIQRGEGEGNFFLKPNGVFMIGKDGHASILETEAYVAANPQPEYATQSGPLLVLDGALHPRFEENGKSRYIRNGVGIRPDKTVVFAISLSEVSFGSFARLFRDGLGCPDALYFDGVVSALSNGKKTILGGKYPAGPIVAVLPATR
jgi:uncharacterized protein YigE (DUF2233 family)